MAKTSITINKSNIKELLLEYKALCENFNIEDSLKGLRLITWLKRGNSEQDPYPKVSFYEASNRIMSDLVILTGMNFLFTQKEYENREFHIELGNSNIFPFDIQTTDTGPLVIGEAFSVAPAFFQTKKSKMWTKLRKANDKGVQKILIFNDDAVSKNYTPKYNDEREKMLIVDIENGKCRFLI